MNLNQKLTQLRKQVGRTTGVPLGTAAELSLLEKIRLSRVGTGSQQTDRHRANATPSQKKSDEALAAELNGTVLSEGLIYRRTQQSLDNIHGKYNANALTLFEKNCPDFMSRRKVCYKNLLFIDTETTGLSGGTGTLVFLLGVAEITHKTVINHQLLLNGFRGEPAMLTWLSQILTGNKILVSYNGKSFDIPLLANRFRLNRMDDPLVNVEHIDLLHWVRRMYQKYWSDCRLPSAEQHCLGFLRENDISGAEAPSIWTALIRFGDTSQLKLLMRHHYWDVLSLLALLDHVIQTLEQASKTKINFFAVANFMCKQGDVEPAICLLEPNRSNLCDEALLLLAKIYRKQKKYEFAEQIWQTLSSKNHVLATEYLAKYHEHTRKQYSTALQYTQKLIMLSHDQDHINRKTRLLRKLEKSTVSVVL